MTRLMLFGLRREIEIKYFILFQKKKSTVEVLEGLEKVEYYCLTVFQKNK